ncbi:MAG TPA: DUF6265 family protein [Phycisphaerales bacterium]|nr:DUF6265 family protein [Phycisphaerales bacterium]
MHRRTWLVTTLALLASLGILATLSAASAADARPAPDDALRALDGEWIYVEDRTEGRALEQLGPPMSAKFSIGVEEGAVILNGHGSGHRDVRIALDGSITEVAGTGAREGSMSRYRGEWKDGALRYEVDFVRAPGQAPEGLIRREFRVTPDGLIVRFSDSVGLYRHPQDIAMPARAPAAIRDVAWLAGAWVGTRGAEGRTSIEERWSPPLGGAMLALSRTVSRDRMSAFEFLRIIERDGGLVYIAQPNGAAPTEFVLTELGAEAPPRRAVFENPRHDYPKRIVYELSAEGGLSATIGFTKGGTPRRFEFKRESK